MKKIEASDEDNKKRLDKFLTEKLTNLTRSQIKKLIKHGQVLVNGKTPSVHEFLKTGDFIEIKELHESEPMPVPEIPVLLEGSGFVVINKPAGVLSHPNHVKNAPILTDWLIEKFPETKNVGDPERPGIVHRLDKETSGVIVIATTQPMFDHLKKQFHDRLVKKSYTALVHGHLADQSGQINKPIGRSRKNGRMAARAKSIEEKDRAATTDYKVIKRFQKYDLVQAQPLTGRTHQIRVHFMSLGHPVVGDRLYRIRGQKKIPELNRPFLHSSELTFNDMAGKEQKASAPLPQELQHFLSTLN